MNNLPSSEEILETTKDILSKEGQQQKLDTESKLQDLVLPALGNSRDIQSYIYSYEPPHGSGILRRLKNFVLLKLRNVTVSTMEKTIMRQQKFNELAYQAIVELEAENHTLRQQLAQLSKPNG